MPEGGEGRCCIEKTYLDDKSYYTQGEAIVFARSLGIGRNAIVLPVLLITGSSNVAAQVTALPDGRVKFVFENVNGYAADVDDSPAQVLGARRLLVENRRARVRFSARRSGTGRSGDP